MADMNIFDNVLYTLNNISVLKKLQCEQSIVDLKATTKRLYDFTKEQYLRNTNALPELIIEDFDDEQIWQQLELQNDSELTYFLHEISKILSDKKKLIIPVSCKKFKPIYVKNDSLEQENEDISDDRESENESVKTKSILKKKRNDMIKKRKRTSIVDDKFFKLQELHEYLTKEERKEKQGDDDSLEGSGSDNESVDFFNDLSEEDDEDAQGKYLKYTDFFDNPPSEDDRPEENKEDESDIDETRSSNGYEETEEDEGSKEDNEKYSSLNKRVKFNLTNDSDETDSLENKMQLQKEDKEKDEKDDTELKSSLEARQERLLMRIKELEKEALGEKPWQLKGEVSGTNRPQNSLLEEFVEFDVTTRPAPIITEETTIKLEDIIKQRIKDKTWDDVEKKFKPVETPLEYKKKLVMDQEKSKESLSQIYEKEYLRQKQALHEENDEKIEEVPELHREIRKMMYSLMSKLDALSNYHYTPKRAKPEIKIISNLPAINMEEVAPIATSDAALLAPEEIKAKSHGDLIGKSERTKTDKKRERRQKKMRQRAKKEVIEKKEKLKALKPGIAKRYKKEETTLLKKLTKDRNITKLDETSHKVVKSSTMFFTQLQNQVKNQIKMKTDSTKKKDKNALSAIKLKL